MEIALNEWDDMIDITVEAPAVDPQTLSDLTEVDVPTFGHFLEEAFLDSGIRRMAGTGRVAGRAVTVRTTAMDSALVHYVTGFLKPNDVLFIDTGGDRSHAPVGGLVIASLRRAGVAGVVIDGVCTDLTALRTSGVSVYARGTSALTTKLLGLAHGGINVPVSIGGVAVLPGYVALGDDDGLLVGESSKLLRVLTQARESEAAEPAIIQQLEADARVSLADLTAARGLIAKTLEPS